MAKRLHAGAESRKHGCCRCGTHARRVSNFKLKTGRIFCLCDKCKKRAENMRGKG